MNDSHTANGNGIRSANGMKHGERQAHMKNTENVEWSMKTYCSRRHSYKLQNAPTWKSNIDADSQQAWNNESVFDRTTSQNSSSGCCRESTYACSRRIFYANFRWQRRKLFGAISVVKSLATFWIKADRYVEFRNPIFHVADFAEIKTKH